MPVQGHHADFPFSFLLWEGPWLHQTSRLPRVAAPLVKPWDLTETQGRTHVRFTVNVPHLNVLHVVQYSESYHRYMLSLIPQNREYKYNDPWITRIPDIERPITTLPLGLRHIGHRAQCGHNMSAAAAAARTRHSVICQTTYGCGYWLARVYDCSMGQAVQSFRQ